MHYFYQLYAKIYRFAAKWISDLLLLAMLTSKDFQKIMT